MIQKQASARPIFTKRYPRLARFRISKTSANTPMAA
jgi:hypothetical protein